MRRRARGDRLVRGLATAPHAPVRTFLIADVRGYTRFTEEYGDEAAARLAAKFTEIVNEGVQLRGGRIVEVRGDEALAVFESARQAIRAATDLQQRFREETDADAGLPLRVGIGIDSGEAIELEDGSFRGAALNVAARLSGLAHGEEVLVSEGTSHLAGRLQGLRYVDRGRAHLKGISDPVRVIRVADEQEAGDSRWIVMFFSGRRGLGWGLGLIVVLVAAVTAGAVVYLTNEDSGPKSAAQTKEQGGSPAPTQQTQTAETETQATTTQEEPPSSSAVAALMPPALWNGCEVQTVPDIGAAETAVCLPPADTSRFTPDRWQISIYPNGSAVRRAYRAERSLQGVAPGQGKCTRLSWGGEGPWEHGPGKPGGREFCYFDGDDAVIVWTHERLGQPDHRDILGIAREGGSDHARLARWWNVQHHVIGKSE